MGRGILLSTPPLPLRCCFIIQNEENAINSSEIIWKSHEIKDFGRLCQKISFVVIAISLKSAIPSSDIALHYLVSWNDDIHPHIDIRCSIRYTRPSVQEQTSTMFTKRSAKRRQYRLPSWSSFWTRSSATRGWTRFSTRSTTKKGWFDHH